MDYYQILQRSWRIVKREKVLWIFGMVLVVFSGGAGFNVRVASNLPNFFNREKHIPQETSDKITHVLGTITSNPEAFIHHIITQIPIAFWISLVIGILIVLLYYVVLGIFLRNWATGALYQLVYKTEDETHATIEKGTQAGLNSWKRLFLISLILKGGFILGFIGSLLFLGIIIVPILLAIKGVVAIIIGATIIGVYILALIVAIIYSTLWVIFAQLIAVCNNYGVKKSLSTSFKLTKQMFWRGIVMGIINTGIGCMVSCGMLLIFGIALSIIFFGFIFNKTVGFAFVVFLGIPLLLLFFLGVLINGIIKTFTTSNWVIFFKEVWKQYQDQP